MPSPKRPSRPATRHRAGNGNSPQKSPTSDNKQYGQDVDFTKPTPTAADLAPLDRRGSGGIGDEQAQPTKEKLLLANRKLKARLKKLAQSNADLQSLLASTHVTTIFLDRALGIQHRTPHATPLHNLILRGKGDTLSDLSRRLDYPELMVDARRALDQMASCEREVRAPDGSWLLIRTQPRFLNQERPTGVVLSFADITARKLAEDNLRASEERFRVTTDSIPQIVWRCDARGTIEFLNHRWFTYTGDANMPRTASELAERFIHPDDVQATNDALRICQQEHRPYQMEHRIRAANGEYHWFLVQSEAELDPSTGEVVRWFGTSTDICEQKATQAALKATAERLSLALASTRSGTWDWNMQTGQVLWSPEHNAIFDFPPEQLEGHYHQWRTRLHPDDLPRMTDTFLASIKEQKNYQDEYRVVHRDGSVHWVASSGRTFYDPDGKPLRMIGVVRDVTERKQAADALRRSEADFRQLADAVAQIIWVAGPDGTVLYNNQEWYDFSGWEPGIIDNERSAEILHPDDLGSAQSLWRACIQSGEPYESEFRMRRKDGVYRWFLGRARPVRGADGRIEHWYGTSTDITERKEAAVASDTAAERLRLAMEATHSGAWDHDKTTDVIFWTPEHNAIFGLPGEQRIGNLQQLLTCVHPGDRESLIATAEAAIAQRRNFVQEFRVVHPGGAVHWVQNNARAFYDAAGQPVRVVGVVRDITAHKEAEAALRESEERFRLACLHAPYPVMLHTDAGEIVQINDAWTRYTGYSAQELTTMEDWMALAHPDSEMRRELQERMVAARDHPGVYQCKGYRLRCADGRERVWDVSSAALGLWRDGQTLRITTAVDVTTRHESEVALRAAKEEAEKANRAKSEFLSRMSHELRTPLNAILGFGQVLKMSLPGERDKQAVEHILKGGKILLSLVDEVLDLARVEAGELNLHLQPTSLGDLARDCTIFVAKLAAAAEVVCTVKNTPAAHKTILADERRLQQVVLNLLSNAIKYNHPGGKVTLHCETRPGGRVRLLVTDTGSGIARANLERLFVPFERLGQELGPVEGTGLGLVVARQLVEAMGGSLGAKSRLRRGSTFWVEFPAQADSFPRKALPPSSKALPVTQPQGPCPVTLLYIEDNASNQQFLRMAVERLRSGWRCFSAMNGSTGLEQARRHQPNLILLDLELPGMKGDTVLRELRASPETSKIPVVMLSADATAHSRERLLALKADGYLSKPFNIIKLLEKIESMLAMQPVSRDPMVCSREEDPSCKL